MSPEYYVYHIGIIGSNIRVEKKGPGGQPLGQTGRKLRYGGIAKTRIQQLSQAARKDAKGKLVVKPDLNEVQELGEKLFSTLFGSKLRSDLFDFYKDTSENSRAPNRNALLRVELEIDEAQHPELAALPWEFLCSPPSEDHNSIWLGATPNLIFARCPIRQNTPPSIQLPTDEQLRIALVVADTKGGRNGPVLHEEIWKAIQNLPDAAAERELTATRKNIDNMLMRQRPHIFHFIGHARFKRTQGQEIGQIGLVHEVPSDEPDWIDADEFSGLFLRHRPHVVFLQACESATQSDSKAFVSIASQVIRQNIPVVVAMQYKVTNSTGTSFAQTFYAHLVSGEPVDKAVQEGRYRLAIKDGKTTRDFATPVLFMSVPSGQLLPSRDQSKIQPEITPNIPGEPPKLLKENPVHQQSNLEYTNFPGREETVFGSASTIGIPPPYAGLEHGTPPTSLYVFCEDAESGPTVDSMPFDLGMIWGVSRSSFIGIIAEEGKVVIYNHLTGVERALYEAVSIQQSEPSVSLPARWWIRVRAQKYPNGPMTSRDVWEAAVDTQNELVKHLIRFGLPPGTLPGIFINVESPLRDTDSSILVNWCRGLLREAFPSEQLAIIFHFTARDTPATRESINRLKNRLKSLNEVIAEGIPVEVMTLDRFCPEEQIHSNEDEPDLHLDHQPGACFWTWMRRVAQTEEFKRHSDEANTKYQQVFSKYRTLEKFLGKSGEEKLNECPIQNVVGDLDQMAQLQTPWPDKIDQEFLSLIREYLPENMYSLVEAFSRSSRSEARRTALIIAADSDTLLDAWVAGSGLNPSRFPGGNALYPRRDEASFVDTLALAVARYYRGGITQDVAETARKIIHEFSWFLKADVNAVCELCLAVADDAGHAVQLYNAFLKRFTEDRIYFIIRAKEHIHIPLESLKPFLDFEHPDAWWMLLAVPPTRDRITELLSLDAKQRAVLSFCNIDEWRQLQKDPVAEEKLLDCRRQRRISYRLASR